MALSLALTLQAATPTEPARYFGIRVVDAETERGVPLAQLRTVNQIEHVTDSAGLIAFDEPGLMDREVFFHVQAHGYAYPIDGFGQRGVKLTPRAGARATIKVTRTNLAERLYRVTGAGIYRDSVLLGEPVPLRAPLLAGGVLGQDTVIVTPYRGRLYWFWGDTDRASYPLGNFGVSGATSALPSRGGLSAAQGVDFTYLTGPDGFARPLCPDFGPGMQWIEGVITLPDADGRDRLFARVASQKDLGPATAWHFAEFDDAKGVFVSTRRWNDGEGHDSAHPFKARVGGETYVYWYPNYRVRADRLSAADPSAYEAYTCLAGDGRMSANTTIDRGPDGRPRYRWQRGGARLHASRLKELVRRNLLLPEEAWLNLQDIVTGQRLELGRGSVFWNDHRQRWILLTSAAAGEIWFAESDTPTGPWGFARRVVQHDRYNFYNPTQHPFFDEDGGRQIYFEGTYTASFSAAPTKTARYDYNQIMYRLDLDDARLRLPVPVYELAAAAGRAWRLGADFARSTGGAPVRVPFFALGADASTHAAGQRHRNQTGVIPVFAEPDGRLVTTPDDRARTPLFHALPTDVPPVFRFLGGWSVSARGDDNANWKFDLELRETDHGLEVHDPAGGPPGVAELDAAGGITLYIGPRDARYELVGAARDEALAGTWRAERGTDHGTWTAQRIAGRADALRSPAIVALYECRHETSGAFRYVVESEPVPAGFIRAATPLCRVWRNPSAVLTLDSAEPLPLARPSP